MNKEILIIYKSVTGFTAQYARCLAEELDCTAEDLKAASAMVLSGYKTLIFGGRFHAGFVDGLKEAKALFRKSGAARFIVFATGATPAAELEMIEAAWKNNLTEEELAAIAHFYLPGGLRYEKMPLGDKLMMRVFAAMVKHKKEKSEYERAMAQAVGMSYDISSKEYIKSLVDCARQQS